MSGLASDLQQVPIRFTATRAPVVADIHAAAFGATLVIVHNDRMTSGQAAKPPGEDPNRVGDQLGIGRIVNGTFHGRGVGSDLAPPFQSLAARPPHQEPVDLSPGGGLDAADVLLQAGGAGGPVVGQAGEATETLGVAQEKRQLGVGELTRSSVGPSNGLSVVRYSSDFSLQDRCLKDAACRAGMRIASPVRRAGQARAAPSTFITWPATNEALSEHSHTTASAISSGRPMRPILRPS